MEIQDRLIAIRKYNGLNQESFGKKIGVTRSAICNYENGTRTIGNQVILSICREFHVDETWFRTGKGEMSIQKTPDDEFRVALERIMNEEPLDFKKRFIKVLSTINSEQWKLLESKIMELASETDTSAHESDLATKVAALERQNRELLARVAAIEQEDALNGLGGGESGNNVG